MPQKKYLGFNAVEFFPDQSDEMGLCRKGVIRPWKKLRLYPTDLTNSAAVLLCKGMGEKASDGFVECVGLFGGFLVVGGSGMNLRANSEFALHSCQNRERHRKRDSLIKNHRDCDDKCCSRMRLVGPVAGRKRLTTNRHHDCGQFIVNVRANACL
jgi:hypothetical protein